jgi:Flp pilus assembly protein TadG
VHVSLQFPRPLRAPHRTRRGQALVEFALALPIILAVMFGAVEFGTALYDKAVLTNASREGARAGVVATNPRKTDAQIDAVVQAYVANNMINFKGPMSTTTAVSPTPASARTPGTPGTCALTCNVTVTVTYSYRFFLLPKFLTEFTGPLTLRAATSMKME